MKLSVALPLAILSLGACNSSDFSRKTVVTGSAGAPAAPAAAAQTQAAPAQAEKVADSASLAGLAAGSTFSFQNSVELPGDLLSISKSVSDSNGSEIDYNLIHLVVIDGNYYTGDSTTQITDLEAGKSHDEDQVLQSKKDTDYVRWFTPLVRSEESPDGSKDGSKYFPKYFIDTRASYELQWVSVTDSPAGTGKELSLVFQVQGSIDLPGDLILDIDGKDAALATVADLKKLLADQNLEVAAPAANQ